MNPGSLETEGRESVVKTSVFIAAVRSKHHSVPVRQRVAEIAQAAGLDAARREAFAAEVERIVLGLIASGGGDVELLVDDGPKRDFLLCAGDQIAHFTGPTDAQVPDDDEDHSSIHRASGLGQFIARVQSEVRERLTMQGRVAAAEDDGHGLEPEFRARVSTGVGVESEPRRPGLRPLPRCATKRGNSGSCPERWNRVQR